MIIAVPPDEDLCIAPELAILTALEASLAIAAKVLNIAHTAILAPGHGTMQSHYPHSQHPNNVTVQGAAVAEVKIALEKPDQIDHL